MGEWIGFGAAAAALVAVFGALLWALRGAQRVDPLSRGQDAASPGGFYTDLGA